MITEGVISAAANFEKLGIVGVLVLAVAYLLYSLTEKIKLLKDIDDEIKRFQEMASEVKSELEIIKSRTEDFTNETKKQNGILQKILKDIRSVKPSPQRPFDAR